jgi:pSer/pThr/pTyr-binding forkhead associated (FHA) protein
MPHIKLDDKEFPLQVGEVRVGGTGADIALASVSDAATVALIDVDEAAEATIRRVSGDWAIRVNGVALGEEPVPLIHGDRIEISGQELRFAGDATSGNTLVVPALTSGVRKAPERVAAPGSAAVKGGPAVTAPPASAPAPVPSPAPPKVPATNPLVRNGRLVSLVDGREYAVAPAGLRIGRDAASDVVIAKGQVSRRHAEIVLGPSGYALTDLSKNGVLVNGQRVAKSHVLARGEVLRIGDEEFRFHAETAQPGGADVKAPAAAASPAPQGAAARPVGGNEDWNVHSRAVRLDEGPTAEPPRAAAPATPLPAAWATFEVVNEGVLKGQRFEVRSPLTHIGRGAYNDIVITDESVSDSHAKLQRRESEWVLVDLDSTNGSYVGGTRVKGEHRLESGMDVRFGRIKMLFKPLAESGEGMAAGTRVIVGIKAPDPRRGGRAGSRGPAAPRSTGAARTGRRVVPWVVGGVVVLVAGLLIFLALQGR